MTHRDDLYYQAAQDDWRGCCARPEEALLLLTLDLGGRGLVYSGHGFKQRQQ